MTQLEGNVVVMCFVYRIILINKQHRFIQKCNKTSLFSEHELWWQVLASCWATENELLGIRYDYLEISNTSASHSQLWSTPRIVYDCESSMRHVMAKRTPVGHDEQYLMWVV